MPIGRLCNKCGVIHAAGQHAPSREGVPQPMTEGKKLNNSKLYVLARNVINAWESGTLMGGTSLDYLRDELNRIDPPRGETRDDRG
jgi:hypothetical protein